MTNRLGIARSQLYARALSEFLDQHSPAEITAALDAVYADVDSTLETRLVTAQRRAVSEDDP